VDEEESKGEEKEEEKSEEKVEVVEVIDSTDLRESLIGLLKDDETPSKALKRLKPAPK
jgi:hypothetical protein